MTLIMSLVIHGLNSKWEVIQPPADKTVDDMSRDYIHYTFFEIAIAGLIQDVLLMATNRYGTLMLFQAIIFSLGRFFSGTGILLLVILCLVAGVNLKKIWLLISRLYQRYPVLLPCCLALCFAPTIGYQIYQDHIEKTQIEAGIYWPWNYRWEVPVMKAIIWHI